MSEAKSVSRVLGKSGESCVPQVLLVLLCKGSVWLVNHLSFGIVSWGGKTPSVMLSDKFLISRSIKMAHSCCSVTFCRKPFDQVVRMQD